MTCERCACRCCGAKGRIVTEQEWGLSIEACPCLSGLLYRWQCWHRRTAGIWRRMVGAIVAAGIGIGAGLFWRWGMR